MVDSMPTSQAPPSSTSRLVAELVVHVLRRGRADAAEAVGAGPGHAGHAGLGAGQQQRLRHRMRRAAQADGVLPAGGGGADAGLARQDQRQRAGPEGLHQLLREGGSGWAKRDSASVPSGTWTISGWSLGRPLAAKMPATAMSLVASAPRP
jgi:hypothetical protein